MWLFSGCINTLNVIFYECIIYITDFFYKYFSDRVALINNWPTGTSNNYEFFSDISSNTSCLITHYILVYVIVYIYVIVVDECQSFFMIELFFLFMCVKLSLWVIFFWKEFVIAFGANIIFFFWKKYNGKCYLAFVVL